MSTIVLIHGGWHHGDCWRATAQVLRGKGYDVHHPDAGGHELGANLDLSHAESCAPITDYLVSHDLRDVVLLGHSYGGSLISKVAEAVPERIKRLVFQNAFVVENGNSVYDEFPPPLRGAFDYAAATGSDGGCMIPFAAWREVFIQDAPLSVAREAYAQLRPQAVRPALDKLDLATFYSLDIPRSFINCTEDMTMTQLPEWGWHPRISHRLGLFRLVQMPGSHEVMFSDPTGLADAIDRASRD
jgi:pimeloyl-ACP methyl ester carboxylesterase